jgi:hypothetical protein
VNKKGQFYLIAAIIIAGIVIGISYLVNYSNRTVSNEGEDIGRQLKIEGEKVMDYELANPGMSRFDYFAMQFSSYANDKDIYFIIVDVNENIYESYVYNEDMRVDLPDNLEVGDKEIYFTFNSNRYTYPLEKGKNFYYLLTYYKGGEQYVYTG